VWHRIGLAVLVTCLCVAVASAADVEFRLLAVQTRTPSDRVQVLPTPLTGIGIFQNYYLEIWVSDIGVLNTGITSAYVDLIWDGLRATGKSMDHGTIFVVFPSGSVGEGQIDELGGSTLNRGEGIEPQWARVAVVQTSADVIGIVEHSLKPSSTGVAAWGRGIIPWDQITLGSARVVLFADCNANGVDDATDIAKGTSKDCNGNAIPDECETSSLPVLFVSSKETDSVLGYYSVTGQYLPPAVVRPGGGDLDYPNGIALDSRGDLYVASVGPNNVTKFSLANGRRVGAYTGCGLAGPTGVLVSEPNRLLVGSWGDNSVKEFDLSAFSCIGDCVQPGSGGLNGPEAVIRKPNGNLLVSSFASDQVLEYDGQTCAFARIAAQGCGLDGPTGLALDDQGNLLVASFHGGCILKFAPDGSCLGFFVPPGGCGLVNPQGIAWGPNGHLFVCDRFAARVLEYTRYGSCVRVFATGGGLNEPTFLTFGFRKQDCNGNGIPDGCDIAGGVSRDINRNGIPDECDVPGDMNCDGKVNNFDIDPFVFALTNPNKYVQLLPYCDRTLGDVNGDGKLNNFDIDPFVKLLTGP